MYAWGDNDHGQQGNGTTTVNRKPTLVQGLEGQKITRVACGSSHSVAWTTVDVTTPSVHEPVLFQTARDSLGASYLGNPAFSRNSLITLFCTFYLNLNISWPLPLMGCFVAMKMLENRSICNLHASKGFFTVDLQDIKQDWISFYKRLFNVVWGYIASEKWNYH